MHKKKIFDNIGDLDQVRFYSKNEGLIELKLPGKLRVHGNIMVVFRYHATFSCPLLFRVTFNTAFVKANDQIEVDRLEISPESLSKDTDKFSENFRCIF